MFILFYFKFHLLAEYTIYNIIKMMYILRHWRPARSTVLTETLNPSRKYIIYVRYIILNFYKVAQW